ncbi:MAG: hypothetical protein ACKVH8_21120 [Pirellulales bacterium]
MIRLIDVQKKQISRLFLPILFLCDCFFLTKVQSEDWSNQINQSRELFQAITEADLQDAVNKTKQELSIIITICSQNPDGLQGWDSYLLWKEQNAQLVSLDKLDVQLWEKIYHRIAYNEVVLEQSMFEPYRHAVKNLLQVLKAKQTLNLKEEYLNILDAIELILTKEIPSLTLPEVDQLSRHLTKLHDYRQAASLIELIRNRFSNPNLFISLSENMIVNTVNSDILETYDISNTIRGASVRGQGKIKANLVLSLPESSEKGLIKVGINGISTSTTTSSQDRVLVQSENELQFNSVSSVSIGSEGLVPQPFATDAELTSKILSIRSPYSGGRRETRVRAEVYSRQSADRQAAEQQAISDLNQAFTDRIIQLVSPVNHAYQTNIRNPLLKYDKFPKKFNLSVSDDRLNIKTTLAADHQLAAPSGLFDLKTTADLAIAFHQSSFRNTINSIVASRKIPLNVALAVDFLFKEKTSTEKKAPASIQYSESDPIHIQFDKDILQITHSGESITSGDQRVSGMDIIIKYRLEKKDNSFFFILSESPLVVLPRKADGTRPKLGFRDYSARRILKNIIERDLPKRISLTDLSFPNQRGTFVIMNLELNNGWLYLEANQSLPGK